MHEHGAHKVLFWMFLRKKHYSELKFHKLHTYYWFVFRNAAWHVLLLPLCSGSKDGQLLLVTEVKSSGYWDHNFLVFETSFFPLLRPALCIYWDQIFPLINNRYYPSYQDQPFPFTENSCFQRYRQVLSSDLDYFLTVTEFDFSIFLRVVISRHWL
jgi:hypothetical protein